MRISNFQKSIIKKMDYKRGLKYNISGNIRRCVSDGTISCSSGKFQSSYKLVYEMNFGCSICLLNLKETYDFYLKLPKLHNLRFCIVTPIKSDSYIKFYLDEALKNYDICVIQQEHLDDNIPLYLLDGSNRIIMAGDINSYPFLKEEYIKRFKETLHPSSG